jgi:hypothetical protein
MLKVTSEFQLSSNIDGELASWSAERLGVGCLDSGFPHGKVKTLEDVEAKTPDCRSGQEGRIGSATAGRHGCFNGHETLTE